MKISCEKYTRGFDLIVRPILWTLRFSFKFEFDRTIKLFLSWYRFVYFSQLHSDLKSLRFQRISIFNIAPLWFSWNTDVWNMCLLIAILNESEPFFFAFMQYVSLNHFFKSYSNKLYYKMFDLNIEIKYFQLTIIPTVLKFFK